jgi:hypothetical protein
MTATRIAARRFVSDREGLLAVGEGEATLRLDAQESWLVAAGREDGCHYRGIRKAIELRGTVERVIGFEPTTSCLASTGVRAL